MSETRKTQFFCWSVSTPQFPEVVSSFLNGEKKSVLSLQSLIDGYLVKLEEKKLRVKWAKLDSPRTTQTPLRPKHILGIEDCSTKRDRVGEFLSLARILQ